jgi:uncharacterized repeat protein (TIGR01451 family)
LSPDKTTIDATGLGDRIFELCPVSGSGCKLILNNLTLQNGNAGSDVGGAITVSRGSPGPNNVLSISNCRLLNNQAAAGGAVWGQNASGTSLTVDKSVFSKNIASGEGGAIWVQNTFSIVMTNSTVSQNKAGGDGGGIHAINGSTVTLTNDTISENTSQGNGGGVWANFGANLGLTQCTVSQNSSKKSGGGIWLSSAELSLTSSTISKNTVIDFGGGIFITSASLKNITNSTISENQAALGGGLTMGGVTLVLRNSTITANTATGQGGGIFINAGSGIDVLNSILSGNTDPASAECIFSGSGSVSIVAVGHDVFGNVSSCFNPASALGNKNGIANPGLGPLANNGGPTLTHAPLAGSPALDNGDPAGCKDADNSTVLSSDQRGQGRKLGASCDSGSVEAGSAELQVSGSAAPEPVGVGAELTYTITVKNGGPDKSFDVDLSAALPAGVTFVSANASTRTCNQDGGVVSCDFGGMDPNASGTTTLVVTVTPLATGKISNAVKVGSSEIDPNPNNNSVSIDSTVNASAGGGGGGGSSGCSVSSEQRHAPSLAWGGVGVSLAILIMLRRRKAF